MEKKMTQKKLKDLLKLLQDHGVTSFQNAEVNIQIGVKAKPVVEEKKATSSKSKEQLDEELVFHSAGR